MSKVAGSKLEAEVKKLTPQAAREWLKLSRKNRRISGSRVERYAEEMRGGRWILGQPIMFNCDGTLIDGHHRLKAVIESEETVPFLVVRGFDRDQTFGKIDDTQTRRLSHWLQIQGEANPDTLATALALLWNYEAGRIPTAVCRMTPAQGLNFLEQHPGMRESTNAAPGTINVLLPRGLSVFLHYVFARIDKARADSFFVDLVMARDLASKEPILLLRQRLQRNRKAKEKLPRQEICALIIKTWNAERSGEDVRQLKWIGTGEKAEAFPEIS